MKILVTGGTGFVGSHLVEALLTAGHEVTCLVRSEAKAQRVFTGKQPTLAVGDLDSATALTSAAKDADVVFHVAALTAAKNRAEFHRVNIQGTQTVARVIEAHARSVRRFIYVSSLAACGPTKPGTVTDASTKPQPVSQYGWSKLAAEEVIKRSRLPWIITRPPTVYGPRDTELLKVFKLAKAGIVPVFGDGTQTGSFVHVSDLVHALIACMDAPVNKTYFPSHPAAYTQRELVGQVSDVLRNGKSAARVIGIPNAIARSALWMTGSVARLLGRATLLNADRANDFLAESWVCSPDSLERDVGWKAQTDLPRGLGQTAEWYLANGWL